MTRRTALKYGTLLSVSSSIFVLINIFDDPGPVAATCGWVAAVGWAYLAYRYLTHAAFYTSPSPERPEGGA